MEMKEKEILFEAEVFHIKMDSVQTEAGKNERRKCGEIFMSGNNDVLSFICGFCSTSFIEIEEFSIHVKRNHFEPCHFDPLECSDNEFQLQNLRVEPIFQNNFTNDDIENKYSITEQCSTMSSISTTTKNKIQMLLDENIGSKEKPKLKKAGSAKQTSNKTVKKETSKKRILNPDVFCEICKEYFKTQAALEKHKKLCHEKSEPFLNISEIANKASLSNDNSDSDQQSSEEKTPSVFVESIETDPLVCRYCNHRFTQRYKRVAHERIHTGEKPFQCDMCDKSYRLKRSLQMHIMTHTVERPHKCPYCDTAFTHKDNLKTHIRAHLSGKKKKCSYCDKLFFRNPDRIIHERIHTGEKPYQCNVCGKCFLTASKLTDHNKRHTGFKPHKCSECEKCFYTKGLLDDHIIKHTGERPHICKICNASFPWRKGLRTHEKIHSDELGYICKICGRGFKQHAGLYSHMKSHGEKVTK